ncbi:MAG: tandem-95 repeat protein, partial [Burkholderiales bacterium]|nr:tandem-95 repeat protein [Burkholderiales bacterium]
FFINDASLTGDETSTAVGDNLNSGKDAAHPMSSLAALLRAYDLNPGDVVHVDTGSYRLFTNAAFDASDSGVQVSGPTGLGHIATISRGNTNTGAYTLHFTGGDNVTIDHLNVTGGAYGIVLDGNADSDNNTLRANDVNSNTNDGIFIGSTDDNNLVADSVLRNNASRGLYMESNTGNRAENNDIRNNANGLYVYNGTNNIAQGNKVHDNSGFGLYNYGGTNTAFRNNEIYNQANYGIQYYSGSTVIEGNLVHHNGTGIDGQYGSTIRANYIYANTTGVQIYDGNLEGNRIYSNSVGVIDTGYSRLFNNVIYANTNQGVRIQGGHDTNAGDGLYNNTILQTVGEGIRLTSNASNVLLVNNILRVDAGYGINVDANSQAGFQSNYNLLFRGPAANAYIGLWNGATQATLAAWQAASGKDANSQTGNPLLLDIDGADNILGEQGVSTGNGFDDNFELDAFSPAIDAGNAYLSPPKDIEGRDRRNDPDVSNKGAGWDLFVPADQGASLFTATGTAKNYKTSDSAFEQQIGFNFNFYGKTYTKMWVNVNGYVSFDTGTDSSYYYGNANSTDALLHNVRIAALWDDLDTGPAGKDVFVSQTATSITVRWAAKLQGTNTDVNVAMTLNADGTVRFDYGAGNTGLTPTIGLSAGNGTAYVLASYDGQANLASANSLLWTPTPGLVYYDIGAYEFQGSSGDTTGPKVTNISQLPANGGTTALAFSAVQIDFSEALNGVSARSPANYELRAAGADGQFDTGDDVVVKLSPFYSFPETSLTLNFGGVLAEGKYRLTLSGTKAIFDTAGNPLDGDANGTPGGDYVRTFTIDRSTNHAPVASPATVGVAENGSIEITLAATDADGDALTYAIPTDVQHGTLSAIDPVTHKLTYTPDANYNGPDSFIFKVDDGKTGVSSAQVTINITPTNTAPVAQDQSASVNENGSLNLLLNAADSETARANLTFQLVTGPAHGTLTQGAAGAWVYTPTAGYIGADSFTWRAKDRGDPDGSPGNAATSNTATFSLTVVNVNDPPVIAPVADQQVNEGSQIQVQLTATDPDGPAKTWTLLSGPAGATLDAVTGLFKWTPTDGPGNVDILVRVSDGGTPNRSDDLTFKILVKDVDPKLNFTAPNSVGGVGNGVAGQAYTFSYTVTDPGTDTITSLLVDWGDGNTETVAGNPGSLTHTYAGVDGNYGVSVTPTDEDGAHPPSTLSLHMEFNDPPVANGQTVQVTEDTLKAITLVGSDPEAGALTYSLVSGPAHGTLGAINASTGAISYTPDADYNG